MFGKVYQGWYKNYYLRSSYEYVYFRILEITDINFDMEMITYNFQDGTFYTPDFFLLNKNNNIEKIVEIKAEDKNYYNEGLITNKKMKDEHGIIIEMLSVNELRQLCRKNKLSFNKLSDEWKQSPLSNKVKDNKGKNNPMFNKNHSEQSKIKNGMKTKERFENNESFKILHSKKVKEAMKKVDKEKLKFENRIKNKKIICCICVKEEIVYTSQTIYCNDCKNKYTRYQLSKIKRII